MRICQIAFETMDTDAATPYNVKGNAKYNGQISPQESRLFVNG
jgi:deoxycytidine triphosphate deaminase